MFQDFSGFLCLGGDEGATLCPGSASRGPRYCDHENALALFEYALPVLRQEDDLSAQARVVTHHARLLQRASLVKPAKKKFAEASLAWAKAARSKPKVQDDPRKLIEYMEFIDRVTPGQSECAAQCTAHSKVVVPEVPKKAHGNRNSPQ